MQVRASILAIGLGCGLAAATSLFAANEQDAAQIDRLIAQLGSNKFTEREAAGKSLDAVGAPALDALKKSSTSPDLEVKRRSLALVKKIEARLESEKLLAPTRLRLTFDDVPLSQALAELATKSGHSIVLQGTPAKYQSRRVTLDTGETTFWQALDALCRQANLVESPVPVTPELIADTAMAREMAILALGAQRGGLPAVLPFPPPPVIARGATAPAIRGEIQTFAPPAPAATAAAVSLADGVPEGAAYYAGAARLRVVPRPVTKGPGQKDELMLTIDVASEPTLQSLKVRNIRLDRAEDDGGNVLSQLAHDTPVVLDANQLAYNRSRVAPARTLARDLAVVHLQQADRSARSLKEVQGTIVALVQTQPEPQITVEDIKNSAGKTVAGKSGGSIKVNGFSMNNRQVRLSVELDPPADPEGMPGDAFAGINAARIQQVQRLGVRAAGQARFTINGGNSKFDGLALYDDKGHAYQNVQSSLQMRVEMQGNQNVVVQEHVLVFQPRTGQGEPARLVYNGSRTRTVEIPFAFRDLKLP